MKYLEEKAEHSANWNYRLVVDGFSVHKTLKELIESEERVLTKLSFKKDEFLYQFTEILISKLKAIELSRSYYKKQISKINLSSKFSPQIQIKDSKGYNTNWLDVNDQCMDVLEEWIKEKRHKQ